ncbi:MAG: DUF1902 domain-containing protein [Treponema sp.]|nr:DUF1902 domain-containing protein [Treponema sp.]
MIKYTILITWDEEVSMWIAENNDIPIALESDSLDTLIKRVRIAAPELLELNGIENKNITLHFEMECQAMAA